MSLKIRLSRAGAKKRPFYRIVVADARMPRDGNDRPNDPVKINKITILNAGGGTRPAHKRASKPAPQATKQP